MTDLAQSLANAPRVLIEAALRPVAGTRIQPTGFPDLGPATYEAADGRATLLVESAQSMANRLEAVCWDEGQDTLIPQLKGLPFVRVKLDPINEGDSTSSILEFHRLNSPYIMDAVDGNNKSFKATLQAELRLSAAGKRGKAAAPGEPSEKEPDDVTGVVNLRRLAEVCLRYDPNSLVHGIFLEKIAGRLRHPRALSAFIEAADVKRADSGGVKFDRALPKPKLMGVDAKGGYGNVPFHRTEFTAKEIKAYFSLDLAQIRGYGLAPEATSLLTALSLWKVRRFLESNMRLRTACELELEAGEASVHVKRPREGFTLPTDEELTRQVHRAIGACRERGVFAEPAETVLTWIAPKK